MDEQIVETNDQDSEVTEQSEDTQEQSISEQEADAQSKTFKISTPAGEKELTADELYEHYQKIGPEFTKRSQKLSELETKLAELEASRESRVREAEDKMSRNPLLDNLDPNVKEVILAVSREGINDILTQEKARAEQEEKDKRFNEELTNLEKEFPGGNGKPRFDRNEVLKEMTKPDNRDFNPKTVFERLKRAEFLDMWTKEALKKTKSEVTTENTTGGDVSRKPEGKTPSNFNEAYERAMSRFK